MTLLQCEAEIGTLKREHKKAIVEFWGNLKHNDQPDSGWSQIQCDLHQLFHFRHKPNYANGYDSPDGDRLKDLWTQVISELSEGIQNEIKITCPDSTELIAIMNEGDELTLVHRYSGSEVHNIGDEDLDVEKDTGSYWYYKTQFFEPSGFREGPYGVPSIYVIGTIDATSQEWVEKPVSDVRLREIQKVTDSMESLIDKHPLSDWGDHLPNFPSGVETRLHEMRMMQSWLAMKCYAKTATEINQVNAAEAPFDQKIKDLRQKILFLEDELENQQDARDKAKSEAFLRVFNFELGQVVTNAATGKSGTLTLDAEDASKIYIAIDGEEPVVRPKDVRHQIRSGEWTSVDLTEPHKYVVAERG